MTSKCSLAIQIEGSRLPTTVARNLARSLDLGRRHRWHVALEEDFDTVVNASTAIIASASQHTGLDSERLFRAIGYDSNDLDPDNLDAAFATLRGINYLATEGFTGIRVLKPDSKVRTADLVATRGKARIALDVACSSGAVAREVNSLVKYMLGVATQKASQLENTVATERCSARGLLFVINSEPAVVFGYQRLYRHAAREVLEALGSPSDYHIAVVTGRRTEVASKNEYFEGPDDVVYPNWP